MKDYVNPALLLLVIILMACRAYTISDASFHALDVWILALCVTAMLVDAALALAKALSRRPAAMNVIWAAAFLVIGSSAWAMRAIPLSDEQIAFHDQNRTGQDPLARDAEGECLLTRAAALGHEDVVRKILNETQPSEALICEAGLRAAEADKVEILDRLARVGMPAHAAVGGTPLLHAAAQNGAGNAMRWLMERGAKVNTRDTEGMTPLHHAVLSGNLPAVQLLLEYGADRNLRDSSGKSAADYARSDELLQAVSPTPTSPATP